MFKDISIFAAAILEAWFAALLYGVIIVVDIFYIRLTILHGFKTRTDRIMCALVVLQALLSTAVTALCLQQLIYGIEGAPIPLLYFADQGRPANVAQTAACLFNNWIADSILVWRLYVVYNKNTAIFIPYGIFIAGSFAAGVGMLHAASTGSTLSELFAVTFAAWAETHWGLTALTQLSASCLIAFRIWMVRKRATTMRSISSARSMPIVWMILESGTILSFTTVLLLAFYASHKIAGGVVGAISGQLAALVPAMILLKVALNRVSIRSSDASSPSALMDVQRDLESTANSASDRTVVHVQRSVDMQEDYELYHICKNPSEK